jgi:FMN phosphatase YigB (HAD superfamily)
MQFDSIMKTKLLILDLDNCLFLDSKTRKGSEEVKDEAWFKVFSEFNRSLLISILDQAKKDISNGKGDRKDIINSVLSGFGLGNSKKELLSRYRLFNKIVKEGTIKIGISSDNAKALELIKIPIYANTASPKNQAEKILRDLNVLKFFKGVYGRPKTKRENMDLIFKNENLYPVDVLYIGDQESDFSLANEAGCKFIGMHTLRNTNWTKNINELTFPIIYSLLEIVK